MTGNKHLAAQAACRDLCPLRRTGHSGCSVSIQFIAAKNEENVFKAVLATCRNPPQRHRSLPAGLDPWDHPPVFVDPLLKATGNIIILNKL